MADDTSRRAKAPASEEAEVETDANGLCWRVAPFALLNGSIHDVERFLNSKGGLEGADTRVRMRVPMRMGRGVAEYMRLSANLHLLLFDFDLDEDLVVTVPGDRMVKVRVMLSGRLQALQSDIKIDGTGGFFEAYPGRIASSYRIAAGEPVKLVILNCAPEFFTEDLGVDWRRLPDLLRTVFELEQGEPTAAQTPLGPDLLRAAHDIMRFSGEFPDHLQGAYLRAKCAEIASYVIRHLSQTKVESQASLKISVRDINRVHEARDLLAEQFRRPPPIPKLARIVGLNQTKLKAAFKSVFGMTIAEFTIKRRMERGRELLVSTNLSIAEIAHAMGYDHAANFTHAFRRFFGQSPRQLRRSAEPQ